MVGVNKKRVREREREEDGVLKVYREGVREWRLPETAGLHSNRSELSMSRYDATAEG